MTAPTRTLLDSSVLVPSLKAGHVHHVLAAPYFEEARTGRRVLLVAAHAIAETFSALTVLAVVPRIPPTKAARLIEESVLPFVEVVTLGGDDYMAAIQRMATLGLRSGAIYDALHVQAAEKAGADELVTINGRDFRRMPPAEPCRRVVL